MINCFKFIGDWKLSMNQVRFKFGTKKLYKKQKPKKPKKQPLSCIGLLKSW